MKSLLTLTSLFLKQLIRRRSLWIVLIVFAAMISVNYFIQSQMEKAIGRGVSFDIATRQAASALQSFAEQIRSYSVFLILIVSALVAPASRKDGTTQFVLTLSVNRLRLALSQYTALSVLVLATVIIVHVGYVMAARKLGIMTAGEMALSWVFLLIPLMLFSAVIFSFSLSHSAIVTYIVFMAIPYIIIGLAEAGIKELADYVPMAVVRFMDNLKLLFPDIRALIVWPKLSFGIISKTPPFPNWTWQIVHTVSASFFWILLGFWFYRNYDFGSRTPTK